MTRGELDWFYGGGAGAFFPDLWARFLAPIPLEEQSDLIGAYHRRLFSGDLAEEIQLGRVWSNWENALASISANGPFGEGPADYARAFARLESHYFLNRGFLTDDQQVLANMHRLADVPGYIVQGRYDMICPPASAWALYQDWPGSELFMVGRAGHALSEPGISAELVRIMDRLSRSGAKGGKP